MAVINARNEFEKLPLEVRQSYDNSLSKWLKSIDDGSFVKSTLEKVQRDKNYAALQKEKAEKSPVFTPAQEQKLKELINGGAK